MSGSRGCSLCVVVLDPMAQDISEQDIVMGEQELPPQMDPKTKMAAVCDTSPSLLRNPPPIPAESAQLSAPDMAQIYAMLAAMNEKIKANTREIKNSTNKMDENMRTMWGETQGVGQCLQADKMVTPRAATNELRGSAPAGEDRAIRETCWARRVEETVTVTQGGKLNG